MHQPLVAASVTGSTGRLRFTSRYGCLAPGCLQLRQYVLSKLVLGASLMTWLNWSRSCVAMSHHQVMIAEKEMCVRRLGILPQERFQCLQLPFVHLGGHCSTHRVWPNRPEGQ